MPLAITHRELYQRAQKARLASFPKGSYHTRMMNKTEQIKKIAREINRNTKLGSLENQIAIEVLDIFHSYENSIS